MGEQWRSVMSVAKMAPDSFSQLLLRNPGGEFSHRCLLDYIWFSQTIHMPKKWLWTLIIVKDHWVGWAWPELNTVCLSTFLKEHLKSTLENPGRGQIQQWIKFINVHGPMRNLLHHWSLSFKCGRQTHSISIDRNTISLCCTRALSLWVHSDYRKWQTPEKPPLGSNIIFQSILEI